MVKSHLVAAAVALVLGAGGVAHAQGTAPAPTTPPERTTAPTTMNNPATATTPPPGSTAAMSTPGTAPRMAPSHAAPVSGANSFTRKQAQGRIQRHGFSHVTDLKLDHQGVWRGQAMRGGKSVSVALDYQGNVVAK